MTLVVPMVVCAYEQRTHPLDEDDRPCRDPRVVVNPCPACHGWGGTCILIHDGSPHGRDSCRSAQWRKCPPCNGSGRQGLGSRVNVTAVELRPFDMLAEGEVIQVVTFGARKPRPWPDRSYLAIHCEVGALRIELIETGLDDPATVKSPAWDGLHERWFDFGEQVTVVRDWMKSL